MPRLTRAESQARTREQLVATAKELFLRDGFTATSLEKVADEAGYSKGAVYSNFRNKNELCLAVLDEIHAEQAALIAEAVGQATGLEDRLAAFGRWAAANIGNEAWTALEVEFSVSTRHDKQVRAALAARDQDVRRMIAALVEAQAADFGVALPLPADTAATALLSLGIGLGLQRAIDPTIPTDVLTDVLRHLITTAPATEVTA